MKDYAIEDATTMIRLALRNKEHCKIIVYIERGVIPILKKEITYKKSDE